MWSSTAVGANCWLWHVIKSGCFRNSCHLCCFHFQSTRRCQDFMQVACSAAIEVLRFGSWLAFTYPCRPKTTSSLFFLSLSLSHSFFFLPIFLVGTQGVLGLLHESRCSFVTHLSRTLYVFVWVLHWSRWSASVGVFPSSCVLYCVGGKEEQKKEKKACIEEVVLCFSGCGMVWSLWFGSAEKTGWNFFPGFCVLSFDGQSILLGSSFLALVHRLAIERENLSFRLRLLWFLFFRLLGQLFYLCSDERERESQPFLLRSGVFFFGGEAFLLPLQLRTEIMQCSSSSGV